MRRQRLYNSFVVALLRSPLHGFMSGSTMLHLCGVQEWQGIHHAGNYLGDGDASLGSVGSILSFGSILSIGSVGSSLSIGSAGSILSIGSSGSILSIVSTDSILSIGSAGSGLYTDREEPKAEGG
jgi:hypothetical protein